MRNKALRIIIFYLLAAPLLLVGQKVNEKDLSEKYRGVLILTRYIILPQEKDVFLQLTTDRDRDIFINTFWKQRDPTPGTPQNEYRDEHIKRFNHANKMFRRGSTREGWMTDMGQFHILLGEPISKERFYGTLGLYPCEVWYYHGDKDKGLPPQFALVFWQKGGVGEFKLYDPVSDGPAALMIKGRDIGFENFEELYEALQELAPTLALVSLSRIPGDIPYNFQPSPREAILLAEIIESPMKDVNPTYATHFLDYKGIVSTEYMENYVESDTSFAIIQDPVMGLNFLHFSMVPRSLSIDYFEPKDQYFCNINLTGSLRVEDDIIFQYTRNFPFYFNSEDLNRIRANGIAIEDSFPLIEGSYRLIILLQNSVGKEFSIFEKDINIPSQSASPHITEPVLGYRFQTYESDLHIPFKVLDKKLVVDPKNTFASGEDVSFFFLLSGIPQSMWERGRVNVLIKGLKPNDPKIKSFDLELNRYAFRNIIPVTTTVPGVELPPDYYEMKLSLVDESGEAVDEKTASFVISPQEAVAHPIAHSKAFPFSRNYLFYYMLASQYDKVNEYEKAEASYRRAYQANPADKKGIAEFADFLVKARKYDESLELIENFKDEENLKFEYYLIKGKAHMGAGKYPEAIESLLEGNKIYNSDIGLLNSLGFCYYKSGEKEKALDALKASLKLVPEQAEVKALVEEIEKK